MEPVFFSGNRVREDFVFVVLFFQTLVDPFDFRSERQPPSPSG